VLRLDRELGAANRFHTTYGRLIST
jgi:hypothetical protein